MRKYIDAEVLKNNIHKCEWVHDTKSVEKFVDGLPTADVQEVRHGRWENIYSDNYKCSVCGAWYRSDEPIDFVYCPNCGSRNDEVEE